MFGLYTILVTSYLCKHSVQLELIGKEVIQPQVPLGLPCYDFTPVMNHTVVIAHY